MGVDGHEGLVALGSVPLQRSRLPLAVCAIAGALAGATQTVQPAGERFAVMLLFFQQRREKGSILCITDEQAEATGFVVVIDQQSFEINVVLKKTDQVWSQGDWSQLGGRRRYAQGEHASHDPLGVLHFLHRFSSETL